MARTPRLKVYNAAGKYIAAVVYAEDAAALIAGGHGPGTTIRDGHRVKDIVWTEGDDGQAAESYDTVANKVYARIADRTEPPGA